MSQLPRIAEITNAGRFSYTLMDTDGDNRFDEITQYDKNTGVSCTVASQGLERFFDKKGEPKIIAQAEKIYDDALKHTNKYPGVWKFKLDRPYEEPKWNTNNWGSQNNNWGQYSEPKKEINKWDNWGSQNYQNNYWGQ